jgi:hypothetical protein
MGVRDLGVQNNCLLLLLKLLHRIRSSSWAEWVGANADITPMQGSLLGAHWSSLVALMPAYRDITTVEVGDGRT